MFGLLFILLGFKVMKLFLSDGAALCGLLQLWHQQLVKPRTKSMCKETSPPVSHVCFNWKAAIFCNTTEAQPCNIPFSHCSCTRSLRWLVADSFWIILCFLTYFSTNTEIIVNIEWCHQEDIILFTKKKKIIIIKWLFVHITLHWSLESSSAVILSITMHSWTMCINWKIICLFRRCMTGSIPTPQGAHFHKQNLKTWSLSLQPELLLFINRYL